MHNRSKFWFWVTAIGLGMLFGIMGCSVKDTTGPFPPPYEVQIHRAPDQLNLIGNVDYRFEARVSHPAGLSAIQQVELQFLLPGTDTPVLTFDMRDDGGNDEPEAGDVVAHDGIFTRVLNPATTDLSPLQGSRMLLRMVATDESGNTRASRTDTVAIIKSKPPQLFAVQVPDTLYAGIPQFAFVAVVADSDGFEDVRFVRMEGWRNNQRFFEDTLATPDAVQQSFTLTGDSTFAAEKKGQYELRFFAQDRSGNFSNEVFKTIYIENTPPVVSQTVMPDTVQLPPSNQQYLIRIQARVWDSQGKEDLRTVSFTVTLEGDSEGDPIEMFDDGNADTSGDDVAGDGIFTRIVTLNSGNQPGTYIFKFIAEDRVGQTSTAVTDTLVITE